MGGFMGVEEVDWRAKVTPELVDQYKRDGVVFVDQLVHPSWLQLIEMGISRILNNSSRKQMFFAGEEGQFIDTVRNWDITPEFQRLVNDVLALVNGAINIDMAPHRISSALMIGAVFPAKAYRPDKLSDEVMKQTLTLMLTKTYDDMTIQHVVDPNFHSEGGRA